MHGGRDVANDASTVFDLVILGGGSGGYAAALRAAQLDILRTIAAHCDGMQYVLQGVDYNNPDATYPIIDHLDHPNYNQQVYDFQMVRFNGASGQTPVIPAMTPQDDNLGPGFIEIVDELLRKQQLIGRCSHSDRILAGYAIDFRIRHHVA